MQNTFEKACQVTGECLDKLMVAMSVVGCGLILFMMGIIGFDVFMRRLFDSPTIWTLDVTEYALLYSTFLAAPIVLKRDGHVRMTAVIERLNPRRRQLVYGLGMVGASIASGLLSWQCLFAVLDHISRASKIIGGIEVPQASVTWIIPFGFLILSLQAMRMGIGTLTAYRRHEDTEAGTGGRLV